MFRKIVLWSFVCIAFYLVGYRRGYDHGESFGKRMGKVRALVDEGYDLDEIHDRL